MFDHRSGAPRRALLALCASLLAPGLTGVAPAAARPDRPSVPAASPDGTSATAGGSGLARLGVPGDRVPGEIVVGYNKNVPAHAKSALRASLRARPAGKAVGLGIEALALPKESSVAAALRRLATDPRIAFAEPNYIYKTASVPSDPRYSDQWPLMEADSDADIDAPAAWDISTGSRGIVVAVVDSGVAYDHADLSPNIWSNPRESANGLDDDLNGKVDDVRGWDFVEGDGSPLDLSGHGTHVAGTIGAAGNNGKGVAGVNWKVSIMPLRALDDQGYGTSLHIAQAFGYAGANGAKIVNASFGGSYSNAIFTAIQSAPGTLFVVAAGNEAVDNDSQPMYPCNFDLANVVCVAASDSLDNLASFSNYGDQTVDLAAPGRYILSTAVSRSTVFQDSFDQGSAQWSTGGLMNKWQGWVDGGRTMLSDSPGTDYDANSNSWSSLTDPVNLSDLDGCRLTYDLRMATEIDKDGLVIETSTDGVLWHQIAGYTGSTSGQWWRFSDDLSAVSGESQAYARFRLVSDALNNFAGADIDSLSIRCLSPSYTGEEVMPMSGTSMAAPHVSGTAALLWAAVPGASTQQVKAALLDGVDPKQSLAGKVVTGGRLSAWRSLLLITGKELVQEPAEGEPSGGAGSEPSPSPTPSEAEPTPDDGAVDTTSHERSVTLFLAKRRIIKGRVSAVDGFAPCMDGVRVKIKRNGRVVARTMTDDVGRFRVWRRHRPGRWIAVAPRSGFENDLCLKGRSATRRHRH